MLEAERFSNEEIQLMTEKKELKQRLKRNLDLEELHEEVGTKQRNRVWTTAGQPKQTNNKKKKQKILVQIMNWIRHN